MAFYYTNARVLNNNLSNNCVGASSGQYCYGAGLRIYGGPSSEVRNNIIEDNYYTSGFCLGGGIQVQNNSACLINNLICGNRATFGGGFRIYGSWENLIANEENIEYQKSGTSGRLSKEIVRIEHKESDNQARQPHLINNTITHNTAEMNGGGLYVASSNLIVINTILWENSASYFGKEIFNSSSAIEVHYSDIQDSTIWPGTGNISKEPMLRGEKMILSDSISQAHHINDYQF